MKDKLVSVITPMYNAQNWIEETIFSVQAQTYQEWEMIIMDDCSVDDSPEIVKKLQEKDKRIKYFRNEKNRGVATTRNRAIECATGRYIAFLDSDDRWFPNKLEMQIQTMQKKDAAFCFSACEVIDQKGERVNVRQVPERVSYRELLRGNVIPCLTVILDRKHIPEIMMPQIPHEDYATWLKILKNGNVAYGVNEILASYREGGNTVSSDKLKAMRWTWAIYRDYLGLSLCKASFYFCCYVWNALKKRR